MVGEKYTTPRIVAFGGGLLLMQLPPLVIWPLNVILYGSVLQSSLLTLQYKYHISYRLTVPREV